MNGRGYRTCWTSATRPLVCMGGASPGKKKRRKRKKEREDEEEEEEGKGARRERGPHIVVCTRK